MPRIKKTSGQYHHGDLRRALLDSAVRITEKDGLGALTLQALARKAGVSSGAPYHHFASREELLAALALEGFELLTVAMREGAQRALSSASARNESEAEAQLRGLGHGYLDFALAHPGHFRLMFRPELKSCLTAEQMPIVDQSFDMLTQAVARCQAEGTLLPGDPKPLILIAWASVHGAASLWIDGPLSSEDLVDGAETLGQSVSDTLLRLLRGQK